MNSDYILNVLETVKFVFCLQIHALAECTMNSKFCILHSTPAPRAVYKIFRSLYIQLVTVVKSNWYYVKSNAYNIKSNF